MIKFVEQKEIIMKKVITTLGKSHKLNPSSRRVTLTGADSDTQNLLDALEADGVMFYIIQGLNPNDKKRYISLLIEVSEVPAIMIDCEVSNDLNYIIPGTYEPTVIGNIGLSEDRNFLLTMGVMVLFSLPSKLLKELTPSEFVTDPIIPEPLRNMMNQKPLRPEDIN